MTHRWFSDLPSQVMGEITREYSKSHRCPFPTGKELGYAAMSPLRSYENGIFLRTLEGNRPLLACLNKLHYIPMTSHDKLRLSHFPITHTQ
jgi:hypothetical protein